MTRALVTGANGFLGSHLVEALADRGDAVRCLVRRTSDLKWLDAVKDRVLWATGDVGSDAGLDAAVDGVDVVYHVAGLTQGLAGEYDRVNAEGTRRVIDACARRPGGPPRMVLVSSAAACGPGPGRDRMTEEMPCRPITPYGRSKLAGEEIARAQGKVPVVVVRPAAIYGPRDKNLLDLFKAASRGIRASFGLGWSAVNLGYVKDIARGCMAAADAGERVAGDTFFIGGPDNLATSEAAGLVAEALGRTRTIPIPVPIPLLYTAAAFGSLAATIRGKAGPLTLTRVGELAARNWSLDLSKAARVLDWKPATDFRSGVGETCAWYRAQGWL